MKLNSIRKKIEALMSAGMPGLYKVLTFFVIQHVYSLEELGRVASDLSVAQIFAFFTAIGWASLIMVRVSSAETKDDAVTEFYQLLIMGLVTMITVIFAAVVLIKLFEVDFDLFGFSFLLIGWSLYQLTRHYFVASKRYQVTIVFDIFLIVISVLLLVAAKSYGYGSAAALSGGLIATSVGMFWLIGIPKSKK